MSRYFFFNSQEWPKEVPINIKGGDEKALLGKMFSCFAL